jgi:hypothetical protein
MPVPLASLDGKRDHVALFVMTAGEGVRERLEKAKNEGTTSNPTVCKRWHMDFDVDIKLTRILLSPYLQPD